MSENSQVPLVVHIIYELGTGGLENGLVNLINRAPGSRYRHAIICLTRAQDFANRLRVDNVQVIEMNKRPGHDLGLYWRLWQTLRRLKPAIVHTRNMAALEMQAITLLLPGVKRVHGEHGRDVADLDGSNRKYQWLRRGLQPFLHQFICVSQDLAAWLQNVVGIPAGKVRQIYNGVDTQVFSHASRTGCSAFPAGFVDEDSLVVGTVGRAAQVKDQVSLVEAIATLIGTEQPWRNQLRLVIVGDGPLLPQLKQRVAAQGLEDICWLPGDRDDVEQLLAGMDIFVLPSLTEGISNTILEAMASALPVIATRTGGNPELVEEGVTGTLVPVSDPAALATAIAQLLDQPQTRRAMGKAARSRIQSRFSWSRAVSEYLDVYDSLLNIQPVGSN